MTKLKNFALIASMLLFTAGCGSDPANSSGGILSPSGSTGTLRVNLTDAPGNFDKVNVTFSEIALKYGDSWIEISGEEQTFDLLTLTGGITTLLGEQTLEAGRYGQLRLILSKAEVVVGGVTHPLTVPGGSASGLKLGTNFTLEAGETKVLVVDFDAGLSIRKKGNGGYMLRPMLRLIEAQNTTGKITGVLADPFAGVSALAIAGSDTVSSSPVDETSGAFTIAFLPASSYTVSLADSLGTQLYQQTGVEVTAGGTTDLGTITIATPGL